MNFRRTGKAGIITDIGKKKDLGRRKICPRPEKQRDELRHQRQKTNINESRSSAGTKATRTGAI